MPVPPSPPPLAPPPFHYVAYIGGDVTLLAMAVGVLGALGIVIAFRRRRLAREREADRLDWETTELVAAAEEEIEIDPALLLAHPMD